MSEQWYFCLEHKQVESDGGCRNAERLGPYDTREAASRALQTAAERTQSWDEDPGWNEDRRR